MINTLLTVNGFKINAYLVTLIPRLSNIFSSPEPKAPGELIGW